MVIRAPSLHIPVEAAHFGVRWGIDGSLERFEDISWPANDLAPTAVKCPVIRIGIDTSVAQFNAAGTGRYSRAIVKALQEQCPADVELVPITPEPGLNLSRPGWRRRLFVLYWEYVYCAWLLPKLVYKYHLDMLHCTAPLPLRNGLGIPVITTLHDVLPYSHPQWFTGIMLIRLKRWWQMAAKLSSFIMASSESTRQAIPKYLDYPIEKVQVIYLGSDIKPPAQSQKAVIPYVLAVGTLEPRKNLERVLDAFSRIPEAVMLGTKLRVVGGQGWGKVNLPEVIAQFGLQGRVDLLGYVSDAVLAELYEQALALVYPSLQEGFGFPVLEAMICGCPVISSNVSSIPEIVGEAGILIDPANVHEITDALKSVLIDQDLRETLRERGRERSQKFSWQRCANETMAVYSHVLARS